MGEEIHIQEKSSSGYRSKYTHSGHNTQRSFDPPQLSKKGYPGTGGCGGQNPRNYWEIIFGPKMMILQRVRHQKGRPGFRFRGGGSIEPSSRTPPSPKKGSIDGTPKIRPSLTPGLGGDPDPKVGEKKKMGFLESAR